MLNARVIFFIGLISLLSVENYAGLSRSNLEKMTNTASDIFIGIPVSLSCKEYGSPDVFEREWLDYEVRIVPVRVLKGHLPVVQKGNNMEIIVPYCDVTPYSTIDWDSPVVHFRPLLDQAYIVFVNKTEFDTYGLTNDRFGFLPVHSESLTSNEKDILKLLLNTLKNEDFPVYLHENLLRYMRRSNLSSKRSVEEDVERANIEYYQNRLQVLSRKLESANREKEASEKEAEKSPEIGSKEFLNELGDA